MTDQPQNVRSASIDPNSVTPAPADRVGQAMNQPLTKVSDDATDQSTDLSLSQANDVVLGQTMTNTQDGNPQLVENPAEGKIGDSNPIEDQSVENQPVDDQPADDPLARLDELLAKAKAKRSSAPSDNGQASTAEDDRQSSAEQAAQELAQKALKEEEAKQAEMMAQHAEQERQVQLAAQQAKMAELQQTDQFKARVEQEEQKVAAEDQLEQTHVGHDIFQVTDMKVTK